MIETAFAKINLALHVRRRRDDGYHEIETLFAFAEHGDGLTLMAPETTRFVSSVGETPCTTPSSRHSTSLGANGVGGDTSLRMTGPFAGAIGGGGNLVTRAADAFRARFGGDAVGFLLDKRLPVAAGIGGGSADAAAALRLLARKSGIAVDHSDLFAIAAALGADVPACLVSETVRGDGRGDALRSVPAEGLAGMPLLLVNPNVPLATGPVFGGWDGIDRGALAVGDALTVALAARNDLEPPACALRPEIRAVLAWLGGRDGVRLARMSGSGATCFALFADDAARDLAAVAAPRGWWSLASRVRG